MELIIEDMISVIIPCYNNFDYLYSALDSILFQVYPKIEIIVADDGSINFPQISIEEYIKAHKHSNIVSSIVYSNEDNYGTVKNINTAILKSSGQFIAILAQDDMFYDADVLSKISNRLKVSKNGVITCRRIMCDESLNPVRYMPSDEEIKLIKTMNTPSKQHSAFIRGEYYEMASGSCTYYTREKIISDGLFDETYRLLEDWTHYIQITRKNIIETAYDITSIYYRTGGISSSMSPVIKNDYLQILCEEMELNRKNISFLDYRYIKYNYKRFSTGSNYLSSLIYPECFISRVLYKIRCKIFEIKAQKSFI